MNRDGGQNQVSDVISESTGRLLSFYISCFMLFPSYSWWWRSHCWTVNVLYTAVRTSSSVVLLIKQWLVVWSWNIDKPHVSGVFRCWGKDRNMDTSVEWPLSCCWAPNQSGHHICLVSGWCDERLHQTLPPAWTLLLREPSVLWPAGSHSHVGLFINSPPQSKQSVRVSWKVYLLSAHRTAKELKFLWLQGLK